MTRDEFRLTESARQSWRRRTPSLTRILAVAMLIGIGGLFLLSILLKLLGLN